MTAEYKELIDKSLREAKEAREKLTKVDGIKVGPMRKPDAGLYLSNYAISL